MNTGRLKTLRLSFVHPALVAITLGCSQSAPSTSTLGRARPGAETLADALAQPGWTTYSSPCAGGSGCPQGAVAYCQNQAGACGKGPRVDTSLTENQSVDGFANVSLVFSGSNQDGACSQCDPSSTSLWGADALWEVNLPNPPSVPVTSFQWSSDFKVPANQTYQALEWDAQQSISGLDPSCSAATIVNFGLQYDPHGSGHWRFFDYGNGTWVDTGIVAPANLSDDTWHTISTDWTLSGSTPVLNTLAFDGLVTAVNMSGTPGCQSYDNAISVGLQLDNVPGNSYTVYYKNYNVTYQISGSSSCNTTPAVTEPYDGETVGGAINLHASADPCVQNMNVYIDDQLVQTISGNVSPVPPDTANWIGGYAEGVWHRLVVVGYASGAPDGASATTNFIWP